MLPRVKGWLAVENEALTVTLDVIKALEQLNIPYLIGGSLASTLHGFSRTTLDSDLVADIRPEHVPILVQQLGDRYYISDSAIYSVNAGFGWANGYSPAIAPASIRSLISSALYPASTKISRECSPITGAP